MLLQKTEGEETTLAQKKDVLLGFILRLRKGRGVWEDTKRRGKPEDVGI